MRPPLAPRGGDQAATLGLLLLAGCPAPVVHAIPMSGAPTEVDRTTPGTRVELSSNHHASTVEIRFARNSVRVAAQSQALLDEVTKVLTEHPELENLAVTGCAAGDEHGQPSAQVALALAASVRDSLVARGIKAERLTPRAAVAGRCEDRKVILELIEPLR